MAYYKKSPSVALELAEEGVAEGFDPYYPCKQRYELVPRTGESVTVKVLDDWEEPTEYPKWERVDYILRLTDFINTLGVSTFVEPHIKTLFIMRDR